MKKMITVFIIVFMILIAADSAIITYIAGNTQNYDVKNYISQIETVTTKEYDISWNDEKDEYDILSDTKEYKVLQLTDIHIGGSKKTESQDLKAFQSMYKLITYAKPDLIVITGDLIYPNVKKTHSVDNMKSFTLLCDFFENIGVPWTFTFGNHDTEGFAMADSNDIIRATQAYVKCLYQYNDPLGGRTNLFINIRNQNKQIIQSLVLLDSGEYVEGGYDSISQPQIEWYANRITELSNEQGKIVPSMLFFHIPFEEWNMIYEKYKEQSAEITYYYGRIGEKNEAINSSKESNSLLEQIFKTNSTKAVFVGHDHLNDLSVEYKGVRFTYGKSIDYLTYDGIEASTYQRGATLILIEDSSEFKIVPITLSEIS